MTLLQIVVAEGFFLAIGVFIGMAVESGFEKH